ncbi:hypothetical protein Taro_019237 [Colocasia esculenta]|uniref:Uncharacterized protein n=1 Tax=Colocasia esculenta TaxID=4460 RepID=A0A843UT88_COLES|nr:hypothetical protein [Colocasia esculenta]
MVLISPPGAGQEESAPLFLPAVRPQSLPLPSHRLCHSGRRLFPSPIQDVRSGGFRLTLSLRRTY